MTTVTSTKGGLMGYKTLKKYGAAITVIVGVIYNLYGGVVEPVIVTDFSQKTERARKPTTKNSQEWLFDWNDATPVYNGNPELGAKFYGGMRATADGGDILENGSYIAINKDYKTAFFRLGGEKGKSTARLIYFWDIKDSTNTSHRCFNRKARGILTASIDGSRFGANGGVRFVIRENNTYYIANRSSSDGVGSEKNPTLFSDDSSLRWAQFTPAEFKSFEEDSEDLGLTSIGEFKPREFTNISGVGLIASTEKKNKSQINLQSFTAKLSDGGQGSMVMMNGAFTDKMILQRNQKVAVYGIAGKGETVTVSFAGQTKTATTGSDKKWKVFLDPMTASTEARIMNVTSDLGADITLNDILVGDIWICGGQSNMGFGFNGIPFIKEDIVGKTNTHIRLMGADTSDVALVPEETVRPSKRFKGSWQHAEEEIVMGYGATAFYMADSLYKKNGVPVGLIMAAVGGWHIESFLPTWLVENTPEYRMFQGEEWPHNKLSKRDIDEGRKLGRRLTSGLYNWSLAPWRPFTFKGFVWYQGESNSSRPYLYEKQLKDMINAWRKDFNAPTAPFLTVEIAPWGGGRSSAWLRESQAKSQELNNVGFVTTIDLGEYYDIHPIAKKPVGERLATLALEMNNEKGFRGIAPQYQSMTVNEDTIELSFSNTDGGLETQEVRMNKQKNLRPGQDPEAFILPKGIVAGFTIAGADQVFHKAEAVIAGNKLIVSSDEVPTPIAVRYGWSKFPLGNLTSKDGRPVPPFRTDTFPAPTDPPVFTKSSVEYSLKVGESFHEELVATDPTDDELFYYIYDIEGPDKTWLSYKGGRLTGTPSKAGKYSYRFGVADHKSLPEANVTFATATITVSTPERQPYRSERLG